MMSKDEIIRESVKRLDFMSGMLLAWDADSVEIDESVLDGWWYMIECIKKDLEALEIQKPTNTTTPTMAA